MSMEQLKHIAKTAETFEVSGGKFYKKQNPYVGLEDIGKAYCDVAEEHGIAIGKIDDVLVPYDTETGVAIAGIKQMVLDDTVGEIVTVTIKAYVYKAKVPLKLKGVKDDASNTKTE